jgi:hypothetical protein
MTRSQPPHPPLFLPPAPLQGCHRFAIHPYNPEAQEEHRQQCRAAQAKQEARRRSAAVECNICYEAVMSKANPAERRFGLMACEHAFCLGCIRSWRSTTHGADVDSVRHLACFSMALCANCCDVDDMKWPTALWCRTLWSCLHTR